MILDPNLDQCASLLQFRVGEVPGGRQVRLRFYFGCRLSFTGDEASISRNDRAKVWNFLWLNHLYHDLQYVYDFGP